MQVIVQDVNSGRMFAYYGSYNSDNGVDYSYASNLVEVVPVEETIIVYKKV
jgi:hypothetical protein